MSINWTLGPLIFASSKASCCITSCLVLISSSVTGSLKTPKLNPVSKAVSTALIRPLVPRFKPSKAVPAYLPGK